MNDSGSISWFLTFLLDIYIETSPTILYQKRPTSPVLCHHYRAPSRELIGVNCSVSDVPAEDRTCDLMRRPTHLTTDVAFIAVNGIHW